MNIKKTAVSLSLLVLGAVAVSCSQGDSKGKHKSEQKDEAEETTETTAGTTSPPGYDLGKPQTYQMPTELLEISGIAFNNGDKQLIYAEQDEDGNIYSFHLGDKDVKSVNFGKHGDYEDVAVGNGQAVVLRSDGRFHSFPLTEVAAGKIQHQQVFKDLLPAGEYEGMHYDNISQKLYVLCKQCDDENAARKDLGYIFNLSTSGQITAAGNFSINVKGLKAFNQKKKFKFRPSALARNPLTKQWFILSSVNKVLVVADEQWNVQAAYPLKGFLQPEGMAFDSQGNLYISNEGDKVTNGNVLFFKYTGAK